MEAKQKAWDLLEKINNQPITEPEWFNAPPQSKKSLKRKALVVVSEISQEIERIDNKFNLGLEGTVQYWQKVKNIIDLL